MKKIKEKIKKISSKNYCFLTLLLVGLLLFAIISQVANNQNIKANAQVTTNNEYIVNGYKFKYSTSMNNLKQNGIFSNSYLDTKLIISETSEGEVNLITFGNELTNLQNATEIIEFYETINNEAVKINYTLSKNGNITNETMSEDLGYVYEISEVGNEFKDFINSTDTQKITINLLDYFNDIGNNDLKDGVLVQMAFINRDFNVLNPTDEQKFNNTIYYNYYLSKPLNYTFNLPINIRSKNYQCNSIIICSASPEINKNYYIKEKTVIKNFNIIEDGDFYNDIINTRLSTYNDLKIIQDNQDGVIVSCEPKYIYDLKSTSNILEGNILTGDYILNLPYKNYDYTKQVEIREDINGYLMFGNQKPISNNTYIANSFDLTDGLFNVFLKNTPVQEIMFDNKISYDRNILNCSGVRSLNNAYYMGGLGGLEKVYYNYSLVDRMISDKLTGLEFIEYQEPKADDTLLNQFRSDFYYFCNSALLGAFIGFGIGLLVGHPLIGAGIGLAIGAGIGAVPLVGDFFEGIGIENNIGNFIRDSIMPKVPQLIPNPGNPNNPNNTPNNDILGLPWWALLLIVVIISAIIYVVNNYFKGK